MTHDDDFIGRLESYLDEYEGVTPLPDAVRDALRAKLPTTRQGGPRTGSPRFRLMMLQLPSAARYGLAAAAVVAAVLIGARFLGNPSTGGPDASPSGSAAPSVTTSAGGPSSLLDSPRAGDLPPGAYYIDLPAYPARIDFEVPEGWWYYWSSASRAASDLHAVLVNSLDTVGQPDESAWGLGFTVINQVPTDPCDPGAGYMAPSVTQSAAAMAEALGSSPDFPVVGVEDVTIGGYSGKRVEITQAEGVDCDAVLFTTPTGYEFGPQFSSIEPAVNQFTFLDVEGSVLVIWTTDFPATTIYEEDQGASPDPQAHVEDQGELRSILESIAITPR